MLFLIELLFFFIYSSVGGSHHWSLLWYNKTTWGFRSTSLLWVWMLHYNGSR